MQCRTEYYADESMFYGSVQHIMGTRFEMLVIAPEQTASSIWNSSITVLQDLDSRLDRFDADSEVGRINRELAQASEVDGLEKSGQKFETEVRISTVLEDILECSGRFFELTEGLFDITLGNFRSLKAGNGILKVTAPGVHLDFGGIAKGYAMEKIRTVLFEGKVENAFVDFGGSSILALGRHPYGDCWKVGLPNPFGRGVLKEFELSDAALSTSGNTDAYSGHIVNPVTGEKNERKMVCSVIGKNPLDVEVLSTVLMIAAGEQKKRIGQAFGDVETEIFEL